MMPDLSVSVLKSFLVISAPVSSLRLKYEYKSTGVKETVNTKQASLMESLTNIEVKPNGFFVFKSKLPLMGLLYVCFRLLGKLICIKKALNGR